MMKIFNHRGQSRGPQNMSQEIDVRGADNWIDPLGHVGVYGVVEHDIGVRATARTLLSYMASWRTNAPDDAMLALNIKEDGLAPIIQETIDQLKIKKERIFCFDMSQAEIQHYISLNLPIATRVSDYGVENPVGEYVWFDWFPHISEKPDLLFWIMDETFPNFDFFNHKKMIGISPELHGYHNNMVNFWEFCEKNKFFGICTDLPEQAEKFFNT